MASLPRASGDAARGTGPACDDVVTVLLCSVAAPEAGRAAARLPAATAGNCCWAASGASASRVADRAVSARAAGAAVAAEAATAAGAPASGTASAAPASGRAAGTLASSWVTVSVIAPDEVGGAGSLVNTATKTAVSVSPSNGGLPSAAVYN